MPSTSRGPRSRDTAPPTDDQLLAWFQAGELLDRIGRYFDLAELDQFREAGRRSGALAAAGKMDLLSLIESGAVAAVERHDFFNVSQFYTEAIPSMDEPVPRMLAAVDALVKLGGADLAATWPNGALREWLRHDPARAEEIISAAGAGDVQADAHLAFALEVIGDTARARTFLASDDPMLTASALTALARMPDIDPASRAESIRAIGAALGDGANDMLCANAVEAIFAIAGQAPPAEADVVLSSLGIALARRGDGTLNRAAHALWAHQAAAAAEIPSTLLQALLDLNPDHKGTVDELDLGLKAAIAAGREQEVLQFLAALLVKNRGRLKARAFNSVWEDIVSGPPDRLSRWIVTWLASGENVLGHAVSEVLAHLEREKIDLTIDRSALPTTATELGYLARKAVGWFMLQPGVATSMLVAVLGVCDTPTARDVAGLLAYPILRNYPETRKVLEAVPAGDPAKVWTDAALQEDERYAEALRAAPAIPELLPSEHNRRIQHLHRADQMQAVHKSAQQQSVFFNLVHHSTLLYGVRSLTYVENLGGGERRPMEMELGTHEFSMMLPRLEMLDPIGLQLLLTRFRGEAKPQ